MGNKKALIFIPEFPVLTETFIEREVSKLSERGNIDVVVFSILKGKGSISSELEDKIIYSRPGVIDILESTFFVIPKFGKIKDTFTKFMSLKNTGASPDVNVGQNSFGKKFYVFLKSVLYAHKFSKLNPDIILAHFLSEPSTIAMIVADILEVPYIISAHAKDITVTSEYVEEKVKTAKYITICNKNAYLSVLSWANKLGKDNVVLAYHGVDIYKISQVPENTNLYVKQPYVLSVGRLVEKKGLIYLLDAIKILQNRGIPINSAIIGSGPLYEVLVEKIKELGLSEKVKIIGENKGLPNEETLSYYKSADFLVFPSIQTEEGDVDGIANVLFEAGAFKLPVIATDAGSTNELIIDNVTGLVCKQKDPTCLANKIEELLNNKEKAKILGENLYNKVKEDFSLDKNIEKLEQMLL
jgi:glycosyltransferase involved in cell wall biosynthesis